MLYYMHMSTCKVKHFAEDIEAVDEGLVPIVNILN